MESLTKNPICYSYTPAYYYYCYYGKDHRPGQTGCFSGRGKNSLDSVVEEIAGLEKGEKN